MDDTEQDEALAQKLKNERKEAARLKGRIDDAEEANDRTPPRIDHADDGGVI